jgi:polyhydroxyalkanoate synthesis regulator phasin
MLNGRRRWLAAAAVAVVLAAGAGAGIAATGGGENGFLADVAKRLGITEEKLTNAIRDARLAQVDEAVQAGELTKEQGERIKERIRSGEGPALGPGLRVFGGPGPFGHHRRGADIMQAAADYLGMTRAELRESLREQGTLAGVAEAQGKSVDGLETAIGKAIEADLDQAVEDGRLTQAQADRLAENLSEHVDRIVEEGFRGRGLHRHGPFGFGPRPDEAPNDPDASFERPAPAPSVF